jgi:localization factor PodJL
LYAEGDGVAQAFEEAALWYRMAAEQGHRDAQYNLGGLYARARGVPPNLGQAYKWFSLAAAAGDADAAAVLERLTSRMTPSEIEAAKAAAADWKPCKDKDDCAARVRE